jgi:hypothetical protein
VADISFDDIWALAPKLLPLTPQIDKAVATAQKIMADPDVKEALATVKQVADIVAAEQAKKA